MAEFDVEFDEVGEGGLVEGVAFDGVGEDVASFGFGADGDEAVGDGDEVFGADVGLFEEVFEESVGWDGVADAVVGDGAKAVEDGGVAVGVGPVGVFGEELLGGVEGVSVVFGYDVGFDGHEGGAFPVEVVVFAVFHDAFGEVGASGVGGEVGEGEEGFGVFGEVAEDVVDVGADLFFVFFFVVNVEKVDAGAGAVGVGELAEDAGLAEFGFEVGVAEVGDELAVDFFVGGGLLGEFAEGGEGEFALAAFPCDAGVEEDAVAHEVEVVGFEGVFGEVVVAAVIRGGGFGEGDEAVGVGGFFVAFEELVGEGEDGVVLLLLEEEGEDGFEVVGVFGGDVVGVDAGEEGGLGVVRAAGEELELGEEEAAFAVVRGFGYTNAEVAGGGAVFAGADEFFGLFDHVVAPGDLVVGGNRGDKEEEHLGVADFFEAAFVFDKQIRRSGQAEPSEDDEEGEGDEEVFPNDAEVECAAGSDEANWIPGASA